MQESESRIDPGKLRALAAQSLLAPAAFERRLGELGAVPGAQEWRRLVHWFSLALGSGLVVSGIIFFFAANWPELHKFHKLGLLAGLLAATTIGAVLAGLNRLSGRILLTAAAVLVGALLALFGQIYQTGADAWELFFGWSLLILPWALLGRFRPLFLLQTVLALTTLALYRSQEFSFSERGFTFDYYFHLLAALLLLAVVAADEAVVFRNREKKEARVNSSWLARLCLVGALGYLLWPALESVWDGAQAAVRWTATHVLARLLYLGAGAGIYFYWTRVVRDLLPLAAWSLGGIAFTAVYLGIQLNSLDAFILVSFVIIALSGVVALLLREIQKGWDRSQEDAHGR